MSGARWRWIGALVTIAATLAIYRILIGHPQRPAHPGDIQVVSTTRPAPAAPSRTIPAAGDPSAAMATPDRIASIVADAPDAAALHRQLSTQPHDEATARAERRIASALQAGSPLAAKADRVTVSCSAELCEMTGTIPADIAAVRRDLANPLWFDTLPRLGYAPGPIVVVAAGGKAEFVQYIRRSH